MIRWTMDTRSYGANGNWSTPFPFGYETMGCSRLLMEWHMRQRLLQNPKITFVEGREVSGLLTDATKTHVTGMRMEAVGAERASVGEEIAPADLVVDSSGRELHAPEWLTSARLCRAGRNRHRLACRLRDALVSAPARPRPPWKVFRFNRAMATPCAAA